MRSKIIILIFIMVLLASQGTYIPTIRWTFEDLGFSDILIENTLRGYNASAEFSSELVGSVTFSILIYANASIRVKIAINNISVEFYTGKNTSLEGYLMAENQIEIVVPPQLPALSVIIYKNSTITARLRVGGNKNNVGKETLRYVFWMLVLVPPILVYLYRRRASEKGHIEEVGVVIT